MTHTVNLQREIIGPKKTMYNNIDENWSIHLPDMVDYKSSNKKGFRYTFVIFDFFSKYL